MSWSRRPAHRLPAPLTTTFVVALTGLVVATTLSGATTAGAAGADTLTAGASLAPGSALQSATGGYTLQNQTDGNLVVYSSTGAPRWASNTSGRGAATLTLTTDGNLQLVTAGGTQTWTSNTGGSGATALVMQSDGSVVLSTADGTAVWNNSGTVTPQAKSVGSGLTVGQAITPLRYLTSPNGRYTLSLKANGRLVLASGTRQIWAAPGGISGAIQAVYQPDGNFVMYDKSLAIPWMSNALRSNPGQLAMQDDGNIVAYSADGVPYWASNTTAPPTPNGTTDTLRPGQQMVAFSKLTSWDGKWSFVLQGDGNAVVVGPGGAVWASNSAGFGSGVTMSMWPDGNLVMFDGSGAVLWADHASGSASLVMQPDGNLVAYTANNVPVWSSRYSPAPPPLFAPVTSAPPAATSRYLRNLSGSSSDIGFMQNAGCTDAQANPGGRRYLTFLAFGAQSPSVAGGWGVILTATTKTITNTAVVNAVKAYIDGYTACMAGYSTLTISVGTNNDGGDSALGATGGQIWGSQVINPLATYAASVGRVSVAAANDLEPGFNGSISQAYDWMRGYLGASSAPFVNTGSADGCPQSMGTNASCNYGWTPRALYDITWGLAPNRSLPLPQIYFTSMSNQWANISLVGGLATGQPIAFAGPLTEVVACQQANSCSSMDAPTAWRTFWNKLNSDARVRPGDLPYTTDLRIDR